MTKVSAKGPVIDPNIWEDELFQGAELERDAHFTVALDKARKKMERFQLPDPRFFILQILQAVIASGATEVRIETSDRKLQVLFDGPGYQEFELRAINDALFESGRSREKDRTRELALGLVSCLALKPTTASITSRHHRWIRDSQGERVECLLPLAEGETLPEWVPSVLSRHSFLVEVGNIRELCQLVRDHCLACPVTMTLDDALICSPEGATIGSCPWPNYAFQEEDVFGRFGIAYGAMEKTQLFLLRYGIQFAKRTESRIHPPMVVVCESPSLRKNVSQSDIVEDSGYLEFLNKLNTLQWNFSLKLTSGRVPAYQRELVQAYLLAYFRRQIPANLCFLTGEGVAPELQRILNIPLFNTVDGRRVSLQQLLEAYRTDQRLLVGQQARPRARLDNLIVVQPNQDEFSLLQKLFEHIVTVDGDFARVTDETLARRSGGQVELPKLLCQIQFEFDKIKLSVAVPNSIVENTAFLYVSDFEASYCRYPLAGVELPVALIVSTDQGAAREAKNRLWPNAPEVILNRFQPPQQRLLDDLAREVQERLSSLYQNLHGALKNVTRQEKYLLTISRATDQLAAAITYFSSVAKRHASDQPQADPQIRQAALSLLRDCLELEFLEDMQGKVLSLRDISTWLGVYEALVVVPSGSKYPDDHGLKATPVVLKMLQSLFGSEPIKVASVSDLLLKERRQQRALASCSKGPELVKEVEETEEEELARLKREIQGGEDAGAPPGVAGAIPLFFKKRKESEPLAERHRQSPRFNAEAVAKLESEGREAVNSYMSAPKECETLIAEDGCLVRIAVAPFSTWNSGVSGLAVIVDDKILRVDPLPHVGLFGIVDCRTDTQSKYVLSQHLVDFYVELATKLRSYSRALPSTNPDYHRIQTLRQVYQALVLANPQWSQQKGPLSEAPVVPAYGLSFLSLGELRRMANYLKYIPFVYSTDTVSGEAKNIVVVDSPFSLQWLAETFGVEMKHVGVMGASEIQSNFVSEIKKCLARIGTDSRTGLDSILISSIYWGEPTKWFGGRSRYFVEHTTAGVTELNPAHKIFKGILQNPSKMERIVPVLASSAYTAINRQLKEIEDSHELAFLEGLLRDRPPSGH